MTTFSFDLHYSSYKFNHKTNEHSNTMKTLHKTFLIPTSFSVGYMTEKIVLFSIPEWTQLSSNLPLYSGAVFTRWGKRSCGADSKLVYRGAIANSDHLSSGGGSNYQCLPEDPSYSERTTSNVPYSTLRAVKYDISSFLIEYLVQSVKLIGE